MHSKFNDIVTKVVLALTVFFSLMASTEFIFRMFFEPKYPLDVYTLGEVTKPAPYVVFRGTPSIDQFQDPNSYIYVNELGYRGPLARANNKENDEIRVLLFGGSTVEWSKISKFLQRALKEKSNKNYKVYNVGISSSVTMQDVNRLMVDFYDAKVDIVIFYGGGNDIQMEGTRVGYPHLFHIIEANPLLVGSNGDPDLFNLILYSSHLFRKLFPRYFNENLYNPKSTQKWNDFDPKDESEQEALYKKRGDFYLKSLRLGSLISKSVNADFIAVFQPLRANFVDLSNYGFNEAEKIFQAFVLEKYKASLTSVFDLYDFTKIFDGHKENFFKDPIHISENSNGDMIIGYKIADLILSRKRTDKKALSF